MSGSGRTSSALKANIKELRKNSWENTEYPTCNIGIDIYVLSWKYHPFYTLANCSNRPHFPCYRYICISAICKDLLLFTLPAGLDCDGWVAS